MQYVQQEGFLSQQSTKFFLDFLNHVERKLRKKGRTTNNLEETLAGIYPDMPYAFTAMTWVTAIAVLLQRQVLKNDEMNGWLFVNEE